MDITITLQDATETLGLGRIIGLILAQMANPPAFLLYGNLGTGKTTLIRSLVSVLPGANQAEVSSPSFNIVNLYPTNPPVAHFDLYRLENLSIDPEILDQLAEGSSLNIIEWAQFLDSQHWPEARVAVFFQDAILGRQVRLKAHGNAAENLLNSLRFQFTSFIKE